jgi:hypothetical protein
MTDLREADHLLPEVGKAPSLPIAERIAMVQGDTYIPYARAEGILAQMEDRFQRPRTIRQLGLLVWGRSGNGKTSIMEEFLKRHPPISRNPADPANLVVIGPSNNGKTTIFNEFQKRHPSSSTLDAEIKPVVYAEVPATNYSGPAALIGAILENFYREDWDRGTVDHKLSRLFNVLSYCGVRIIVIDEVHRMLHGWKRMRESLDLLIQISNHHKVPIVLSGIEEARDVVSQDRQASSRFPLTQLPPWEDGEEYRGFLAALESTLPLSRPSDLYKKDKAGEILELSRFRDSESPPRPGILGNIVGLVKDAAEFSLRGGREEILVDDLRAAAEKYGFCSAKLQN